MLIIYHKGKPYELFDEITVNTTLDSICGTFQFKTTLKDTASPFGIGSLIEIRTDRDLVICTGFIERMEGSISNDEASVVFSGRDILCDLIDSSVPSSVSLSDGAISIESLCKKIIGALKMASKVINMVGFIKPFSSEDVTASSFSGQAGNFLLNFARKRQIFLTTDGKGNLVLFRAPTTVEYTWKLTENSMLDRNFSFSTNGRFNKIVVGSQDNFASSDGEDLESSVDRKSEFVDKEIRETRYLQIEAEESMDDSELSGKAKEEVNIRRARGFEFSCTIAGHLYSKGKLIAVSDKLSGVEGIFLISQVSYKSSDSDTSELTLCFPETYSATGKRTTARKSKIAEEVMNVEEPSIAGVNITYDSYGIIKRSEGWTMLDNVQGAST